MFPAKSKVIIADDSQEMRDLIRNFLIDLGFWNIVDANDGNEALDKLTAFAANGVHIDLLIVDLIMPGMGGMEFLAQIKLHPLFNTIPILMVSGQGDSDEVVNAIQKGVAGFLIKPFSRKQLAKKLTNIWDTLDEKFQKKSEAQ